MSTKICREAEGIVFIISGNKAKPYSIMKS